MEDVTIPPDLVVEILSPGQTIRNMAARLRWYVRHGVRLGWLIQPRAQRVFVFSADRPVEILEREDALTGTDVIPDFALPLAELFGWLDKG